MTTARKTKWSEYIRAATTNGRHDVRSEWTISGVWEFRRSDGLKTPHKMESPFPTWIRTIETGMRLADEHIPLGGDLPAGMRTRGDPDFAPLFDLESIET